MMTALAKCFAAFLIGVCATGCESIPTRTEEAVIRRANAAAQKEGISLADYAKPHAVYRLSHEGHQWLVYYYNSKVPDNPDGTFNGFNALVDDRTGEVRLIR